MNAIGNIQTRILHKMHINKQLLCKFLYNISFRHTSISKPWIPVAMINLFYRCPVVRVVGSLSPAAPCVWPILAPPLVQPSTPRKIKQVGLSILSLSLSLSLRVSNQSLSFPESFSLSLSLRLFCSFLSVSVSVCFSLSPSEFSLSFYSESISLSSLSLILSLSQ